MSKGQISSFRWLLEILIFSLLISLLFTGVASATPQVAPPSPPANITIHATENVNSLTWTPVKTRYGPVEGYNIYRSTSAEAPYIKINPSLIKEERFVDPVTDIEDHFYKISAVDFSGIEGPLSTPRKDNEVSLAIKAKVKSSATLESRNEKIKLVVPPQARDVSVKISTVPTPPGIKPISDVFDITIKQTTGGTTLASPAAITIKVNSGLTPFSRIQYFDGKDWQYVAGGTYSIDLQNNTISYDRITHFSWYTVTNPSNTTTPNAPASVTVDAQASPPYLSNQVSPNVKIDWSVVTNTTLSGYVVYRWIYTGAAPTADKSTVDKVFLPGNVITFTDTTGIPGESYYYGISAENTGGIESLTITLQSPTYVTVAGSEKPHNAYSTSSNLCRDCHETHGPRGTQLLERKTLEKEVCFTCHDGTGSTTNVKGEFAYTYRHPVGEAPVSPRTGTLECRNCHSPHVLDQPSHTAPGNVASNALKGTWGVEPNPWPVPKVQPRNIPAFPGLTSPAVPLGAGVSIVKAKGVPGKRSDGGPIVTYPEVD
ncbi:MAG: cytochrome c3 family protein, partial [Actinomycetota bacterium]